MDAKDIAEGALAVGTALKGLDLLKDVYGDLAKPAVQEVGKALGAVLGLGNTILYPIYAANGRAKIALEKNFERYRQKLEAVPPEHVVEVNPEIGVPIAEKLAYVADSTLAEMYVELLTRASDSRTVGMVHPSFVNILSSLSPDEGLLLRNFRDIDRLIYANVFATNLVPGVRHLLEKKFVLPTVATGLNSPENLAAYWSNLEGLGIIWTWISPPNEGPRDEFLAAATEKWHRTFVGATIELGWGAMERTPFGLLFIRACGI